MPREETCLVDSESEISDSEVVGEILVEGADEEINEEINFCVHHDLAQSTSTYNNSRKIATYACELCKSVKPDPPITDKHRTKIYCVQCSIPSTKRVYLHLECFGAYHRHKYEQTVGSSNVKGLVIRK